MNRLNLADMDNPNFFETLKIEDFEDLKSLLDKFSETYRTQFNETQKIVGVDDLNGKITQDAAHYLSSLNPEELKKIHQMMIKHNKNCPTSPDQTEFPDEYQFFRNYGYHAGFVSFYITLSTVFNEKKIKDYLSNNPSKENEEIINELLENILPSGAYKENLDNLIMCINKINNHKFQLLIQAIEGRITRLERYDKLTFEELSKISSQECQNLKLHIEKNYKHSDDEQAKKLESVYSIFQHQEKHLNLCESITKKYIAQLQIDIESPLGLKNKKVSEAIKSVLIKTTEILINPHLSYQEKLNQYQQYLTNNANTLNQNRNNWPYFILKILMTSGFGYALYSLFIGTKASNLYKLSNIEYQKSLEYKIVFQPETLLPRLKR